MKKIVITGASGLVATELIHQYLLTGEYSLVLISTHPELLSERYAQYPFVQCMSLEEFGDGRFDGDEIDFVLHTAFARTNKGCDYVASLEYLRLLLETIHSMKVSTFVNISSQSVYGDTAEPLWKESLPRDPSNLYALAKSAAETLVTSALEKTDINWTNLRLSSLCEKPRFMYKFVQAALKGDPIRVQDGRQRFSFFDPRDAASGILAMIEHHDFPYSRVYNLGNGVQYSLLEIAERCKVIGEERYNVVTSVEVTPGEIRQNSGVDINAFCQAFSWQPKYNMDDMIDSLYQLALDLTNVPICFRIKYSLSE